MFKEPINRFSGRAARKSTFVIALVAVLAAIAGVTAESASAASFTDGALRSARDRLLHRRRRWYRDEHHQAQGMAFVMADWL